jgi:hypothetical protein
VHLSAQISLQVESHRDGFVLFYSAASVSQSVQYWGWCKHHYREHYKETFPDVKKIACKCLDACPVKVIRHFFNQSWQFMLAYQEGLTRKAAE